MTRKMIKYCFAILVLFALCSYVYADGEFTCKFDVQSGDARISIFGDAMGQNSEDQPLNAFQDRASGAGRFVDAKLLQADVAFSGGGFDSSWSFLGDDASLIKTGSWEAAGGVTRISANECYMDAIQAGVEGDAFNAVTQIGGCDAGTSAALLVENLIGSAFFNRHSIAHSNDLDEDMEVISSSITKDWQRVKIGGMGDFVSVADIKYITDCSIEPAGEVPWWPPGICDPERADPELHPEPWFSMPRTDGEGS